MTFAVTNTFVPKTGTAISSSEMDANFTDIENEMNGVTNNSIGVKCPIGSVLAWLKTYTSTPALPNGWVECNGQVLSDADSVYNGQTIPNLNNSGGATANRFLRGNTTSGGTGGTLTHTHTLNSPGSKVIDGWDGDPAFDNITNAPNHEPPYYDVVWIFRVK